MSQSRALTRALSSGLSKAIAQPEGVGVVYEAETDALVARFTTPPTTARKGLINDLIKSLKTAGVWSKLDALYVMAAADEQSGQRNWIKNAHNLSPVNAPAFIVDRGYDFNGTTQYLNTQYTPSTQAVNLLQDSASLFSWCTENVQNDATCIGANASHGLYIRPRRSGVPDAYQVAIATSTAGNIGTNTTSIGLAHVERTASNLTTVYKNGSSSTTTATASTGLPIQPVFIGARDTDGSPNDFDTRAQAAAGMGASLGAAGATALYNALNTYLTAVGASP